MKRKRLVATITVHAMKGMEIKRRLSRNVKALREARKMSVAELASLSHLTEADINSLETGMFDPTLTVTERLASAFNCTNENLLERVLVILPTEEWRKSTIQ